MVKIKGYDINVMRVRDSFNRRALQFRNNIIKTLQKIGIKEDYVDVTLESLVLKKTKASATWYIEGHRMHYSHNLQDRFIENLYVVSKIIEIEVNLLIDGVKTFEEFVFDFEEDSDLDERRKEARKVLGLDENIHDLEIINKKYKNLAKELHPDMPSGNMNDFKKINHAHKILKRELE